MLIVLARRISDTYLPETFCEQARPTTAIRASGDVDSAWKLNVLIPFNTRKVLAYIGAMWSLHKPQTMLWVGPRVCISALHMYGWFSGITYGSTDSLLADQGILLVEPATWCPKPGVRALYLDIPADRPGSPLEGYPLLHLAIMHGLSTSMIRLRDGKALWQSITSGLNTWHGWPRMHTCSLRFWKLLSIERYITFDRLRAVHITHLAHLLLSAVGSNVCWSIGTLESAPTLWHLLK